MCNFSFADPKHLEKTDFEAFPQSLWLRADLFRVPTRSRLLIHLRAWVPKKAAKIPSLLKSPGSKKMAGTGDIMIQLFSCCIQQQPSPTRRRHHQRLRIDRSMIGNPTNFVHTGLRRAFQLKSERSRWCTPQVTSARMTPSFRHSTSTSYRARCRVKAATTSTR